ncbi:hypothetical protein JHD50_07625 [Sulfurimonas sp. MAG313]|nr:hypothetical protein [Sulfurimonas sp. MAG313]MDF1881171.1 hypothetical protein [Sulfurimonas sp. MAG313]
MRKILYVLLITLAVSSHLNATEYDIFVGGETGLSWAEFDGSDGLYQNGEITSYGVKAGVTDDNTRMYLRYNYADAFEGSFTRTGQYQTFTLNSEAFTDSVNLFSIMDLSMFVGGHLGAININVDANFGSSNSFSALYGVQAGVIARFGIPISLEAGYRISLSNFNQEDTTLNTFQVAYAGINLRF